MEESIGDRLRRLRSDRGWTQNVLGYHAGRAPSVISQVETGKREPELSTVKALADALEVDWRYLLLGDTFPKAETPNESGPHEGLVIAHRAAARLGHTVANSFTNFQRRDLEHLKTFHALEAALAKMRPQDIYGHGPEDLADAQDELGAASHEVNEAMKEHFGVDPSLEPWGEALQHVLEEMEARQRV